MFYFDGDILAAFLFVIDLGVGLIFFIFILHFTNFLQQKSKYNLTSRQLYLTTIALFLALIFLYYLVVPFSSKYFLPHTWTWVLKVTHLDYVLTFFALEITDLNTLCETYFHISSLKFFQINLIIFGGLVSAIVLSFLIDRVFSWVNSTQIKHYLVNKFSDTGFFHRIQNDITQLTRSQSIRTFTSKKKKK